jgi:nitrate/nitrite transport system ATP-binding protein
MDPQILLMDEPLGALDALTRATLQDEIERIWERDQKTVVMITNDVDEGILLADRIIPLSAGPGAILGPSVRVELDRPRDRKAINHCPRFKQIRQEIFDFLLGPGGRIASAGSTPPRASPLPDVKPADLSGPRRLLWRRPAAPMAAAR